MDKSVYKLNEHYFLQQNPVLSDSFHLFNTEDGRMFRLNRVSFAFLELVDGEKSLSDILDILISKYDVEAVTLRDDINKLLDNLLENNVISERR